MSFPALVAAFLWLIRDGRRRARADVARAADRRVWLVHRGDGVERWELRS